VTCDANATNSPCSNPSNAFVDDIMNDNLPAYAFVTPNLENDMHNGSVTKGDNWLHTYLPLILSSKSYLNGEVVVMALWDEQSTSSFGGATPNFFVSPYITKGTVSQTKMNLFAALRAAEEALGVSTHAGCASGTKPGPGGGACPMGSTADVRGAIGF
jgi:acid phosphatase